MCAKEKCPVVQGLFVGLLVMHGYKLHLYAVLVGTLLTDLTVVVP